jgi:prophage maintenance system killer protein
VRTLKASEVLLLHAALATHLCQPRGIAEPRALVAALDEVEAATAGADLLTRAATLATALARHQPFRAGNRAVGLAAALLLLRRYDLHVRLEPADLPTLRALLASGDAVALASWLRTHLAASPTGP